MNNLNKIILKNSIFLIGVLIVFICFLVTYDLPFFWDALSSSQLATWFYNHHFSQWVVPTDINPGHPPFFALLLAFSWQIFGKTILVSRLLLLLMSMGVVYQIQKLIENYKIKNIAWYWYLLIFIDPTFLAQTTIINNDVLMMFFCLLGINTRKKNKLWYVVAITGILFCNLRGMFLVFGFLIFEIYKQPKLIFYKDKESRWTYVVFSISMLFFSLFLLYQYHVLGWVLKSPHSVSHRGFTNVVRAFKNMIAIVWNFSDYGRFLFLLLGLSALFIKLKNKTLDDKTKELLLITLFLAIPTIVINIVSSNPVGPRYFMLFYLLLLMAFVNLLENAKWRNIKWGLSFVLLISGHFWIYPATISQGWDSSLAYVNYFELKKNMQNYILEHNLPLAKIGSKTRNPLREIEYLENKKSLQYVEDANLLEVDYYVHTNIENNTKDAEIHILKTEWNLIKEYRKNGVFVRLYQSPKAK